MLTFLPMEEIRKMDSWEGSQLNTAKEILAFELTKLVHGEEEAQKAQEAAKALFGGGADNSNMPTTQLEDADFTDGAVSVIDMLIKADLIKSRGEGRRLIQQGGVSVNDVKITDVFATVAAAEFAKDIIVKKGKKIFHKFVK